MGACALGAVIETVFVAQMDNVLQDMVHRLRAIERLLRTQNELLTRMLADLEQITHSTKASNRSDDRERIRKRA
jgi:hypothetical protein